MDKNGLKISINFNPFSFAGKDFYNWISRCTKPHNVQNHCNLYVVKRFKSSRMKAADIINIIYIYVGYGNAE